eukprot:4815290-Pyramimonas_sp.AAC.1
MQSRPLCPAQSSRRISLENLKVAISKSQGYYPIDFHGPVTRSAVAPAGFQWSRFGGLARCVHGAHHGGGRHGQLRVRVMLSTHYRLSSCVRVSTRVHVVRLRRGAQRGLHPYSRTRIEGKPSSFASSSHSRSRTSRGLPVRRPKRSPLLFCLCSNSLTTDQSDSPRPDSTLRSTAHSAAVAFAMPVERLASINLFVVGSRIRTLLRGEAEGLGGE